MSKDKTTFSLFDFCKKKADKVQIYTPVRDKK